jgi:maltose alpha-D-glucosyltransferase / alpha-amylase
VVPAKDRRQPEGDPLWYKDAIIYELHARAFFDSNADGIGDFRGLTEKLDYLQDLGVTAVWLLPFYPSPLKDDGYDIADYADVHKAYGTLRDVEVLLREAHKRGLRVITELVLNHTSDQHPWFQRARRAQPGTTWRDFYVWSDSPKKYSDARVIFKDFESSNWTWDPVAKAYYWHRFYAHQPDLNYDNPTVRKAMLQSVDFWMRLGVDGLRLDAVPYLYEREGTNCENLPETHGFLQTLRRHIDERFHARMLLAEANQWPEDAVAYFGNGDECHMAFHFPVMPRMFMAIHMEDRYPIIDILEQTPAIPDGCQWALFLRNHDELTLEMVTDEERDYMYRVYAHDQHARVNLGIRRRLAPLLGNHRRKIELMNGLLLSLPGTPVIYYGDEIGMGDNMYLGDRDGVRTPMQWSSDRNSGFSRANPQRLYLPIVIDPEYHPAALNVEAQQNNLHSLLWWMKRLIALRKRFHAFGRGRIEFLHPDNRRILVFVRQYEDERILVVANLSRFVQYVEVDLAAFKGMVPVELFGGTEFPPIGERPYLLTMGPHAFYWFALRPLRSEETAAPAGTFETMLPLVRAPDAWDSVFKPPAKVALESALPAYLQTCRWFGGKARRLKSASVVDTIHLPQPAPGVHIALVQVAYVEGDPETYLLPLTFATGAAAEQVRNQSPGALVARLHCAAPAEEGLLYDAVRDTAFGATLLDAVARRRRWKGGRGELIAASTRAFRRVRGDTGEALEISVLRAEQSNTSLIYGDRMILKLFRRVEEGINPDLEIGRFLTERTSFAHAPAVAGFLSYKRSEGQPMTIGILHSFVPNQGDAWRYTLAALNRYFELVLVQRPAPERSALPDVPLTDSIDAEQPAAVQELIGAYLDAAVLLGQRTAELHLALASDPDDPDFAPAPFSTLYQRGLYQSMRSLASQRFTLLRKQLGQLPETVRESAEAVLELEPAVDRRFRSILGRKLTAMLIRCHGDYHLGQVLYTGKDFVILDFEGEPARSLSERRIKRSPLRDVSGMLRSFHYAANMALSERTVGPVLRPEDQRQLEPWARFWNHWVSIAFLKSYFETANEAPFLPRAREELALLLNVYMLEKGLYELGYELNNRPEWVHIPLRGIRELLGGTPEARSKA